MADRFDEQPGGEDEGGSVAAESLEDLRESEDNADAVDEDGNIVDSFTPRGDDTVDETLETTVKPRRKNEFTCSSCFTVQRLSRRAYTTEAGRDVCRDCV